MHLFLLYHIVSPSVTHQAARSFDIHAGSQVDFSGQQSKEQLISHVIAILNLLLYGTELLETMHYAICRKLLQPKHLQLRNRLKWFDQRGNHSSYELDAPSEHNFAGSGNTISFLVIACMWSPLLICNSPLDKR